MENFTYLKSCLSAKVAIDKDIEQIIQATSTAFGHLRGRVFDNKDIFASARIRLKIYEVAIIPILLYASDAWVTYSRNINNLEKLPPNVST